MGSRQLKAHSLQLLVYTIPVCIPTHQPHTASTYKPHPPRVPKKSVRKAVSLVSLSSVDTTKASTSKPQRMDYSVVTQVFLCLEPDQCNVRSVGDLVAWQVGFPVILLDSKLYPLLSNEGTSGVDFWRSTRKILAASKSLYQQLSVHEPALEDVEGEMHPTARKKPRKDILQEILDKVSVIEKKCPHQVKSLRC